MKEHIHTMPIYDAFGGKDGCPFCLLFSKMEKMKLESVLDGECAMDPGVRLYYGTVIDLWQNDVEFKALFQEQRFYCPPHFHGLLEEANKKLRKNESTVFYSCAAEVVEKYLESLETDARTFCKSFDYRYSGMELGEARTVVQHIIAFLTGNGEKE
jgi:hypothetical protein